MDGTKSIRCLNCGAALANNEAKLFAEVMVCGSCHDVAERVFDRGQHLLRRLSILLKDTIRSALKSGKVRLPMSNAEVVGDQELLQRIVGLYFNREWNPSASTPTSLPPPSTESTRPAVPSVGST